MKDKDFIIVDHMTGRHGKISVTFLGTPFRLENGKTKRYIDSNFGAWLLDEIYKKKNLIIKRKGLFHKEWFCPSCKIKLNINSIVQNLVEFSLEFREYPSFTLQIILPSVVCPVCKRIYGIDIDGSFGYQLNEAIILAFKSANILP